MESVAIYGGGNIAHSLAAVLSRYIPVKVFTRRPELWRDSLVFDQAGLVKKSKCPVVATANINELVDVDTVFVALPQFALDEAVRKIGLNMKAGATIVFVPAPAKSDRYAKTLLKRGLKVIGFQRVPFIARIGDYGHSVSISSPRTVYKLMVSDVSMELDWRRKCEKWFGGTVSYLSSFASFAFSNSNPLLHPSRLYALLSDGDNGMYERCPLFYAEWTDVSSELYVEADKEMYKVFSKREPSAALIDYESVLDHYEVSSPSELTHKIRSITAFKSILAPWKTETGGCWIPDYESRYFTEDIEYGTKVIQEYGDKAGIDTPIIDLMMSTIQSRMAMFKYSQSKGKVGL